MTHAHSLKLLMCLGLRSCSRISVVSAHTPVLSPPAHALGRIDLRFSKFELFLDPPQLHTLRFRASGSFCTPLVFPSAPRACLPMGQGSSFSRGYGVTDENTDASPKKGSDKGLKSLIEGSAAKEPENGSTNVVDGGRSEKEPKDGSTNVRAEKEPEDGSTSIDDGGRAETVVENSHGPSTDKPDQAAEAEESPNAAPASEEMARNLDIKLEAGMVKEDEHPAMTVESENVKEVSEGAAQTETVVEALAVEGELGEPPERPLPGDCCGQGCEPCVWDTYNDELRDYLARKKALQKAK